MPCFKFFLKLSLIAMTVATLVGCDEREERKVRYVTIYVSQDVEIKETLVDLDMKKPGVLVVHPEGVEVKHWPTKPRDSVSFAPLQVDLLSLFLLLTLLSISCSCLKLVRSKITPPSAMLGKLRLSVAY